MKQMQAVVLTHTCAPEAMRVTQVPVPEVRPGWVLIKVRAFGLNHSEVLLRRHEADAPYIHLPLIPGIECAGQVADASDTDFKTGQPVVALMGGMGRSFHGSYAAYTLVPAHHVFAAPASFGWAALAALPESFYTAYGSLITSLRLEATDTLLVRGATSTVGLAAVQLAHALGARVLATTRQAAHVAVLRQAGADEVVLDEGDTLPARVKSLCPKGVSKVLELVGPRTLRESLRLVAPGGMVCQTGVLGGQYVLNGFDPIKDIPNGVGLTGFYSNSPRPEEMEHLFQLVQKADIRPIIAREYALSQIAEAHRLAEERSCVGKIVVHVD